MIHVDPTELFDGLDEELLDEYLTLHRRNVKRLLRRPACWS